MGQSDYLKEAINLVQRSPLLTPGQKSLYIERIRVVSVVEQRQIIAFLKSQHELLEGKLSQIPVEKVFERINSTVNQKLSEKRK
jgi:hypothetical protein